MLPLAVVLFALATAYLLRVPVVYAMIGALIPGVSQLLMPYVPAPHHTAVETPAFAVLAGVVAYLVSGRRSVGVSLVTGIGAWLFLQLLVGQAVLLYYPATAAVQLAAERYRPVVDAAVIGLSSLAMLGWRYQSRWEGRRARYGAAGVLWIAVAAGIILL